MARDAQPDRFAVCATTRAGITAVHANSARAFGRHTHDDFGVVVMVRGAHDSASARGPVRAEPGDVIVVNPGEVHDGRPVQRCARQWTMLYFDPSVVADVMAALGRPRGAELEHAVLRSAATAHAFAQLFEALTQHPPAGQRLHADALLLEVFEPLVGGAGAGAVLAPVRAHLEHVRQLIDDCPEAPLTLAELAAVAGCSRYSLLRSFKSAFGLPPHAYALQRRLGKARRLILSGSPVATAAAAAGFADQAHLTRHFVRAYGVRPGALAAGVRRGAAG